MTSTAMTLPTAADPAARVALAIAGIAALTLGGAWFFQLVLDIKPCPLCLEQRYAYYLAMPLALLVGFVAARHAPRTHASRTIVIGGFGLLFLAAVANAWLGGYHAGVEWQFWAGPTDCSGTGVDLSKAGNLLDQLDKVKVVRCDEVQWRFLGLSLAGYNVLISLLMAALAVAGIAKAAKT